MGRGYEGMSVSAGVQGERSVRAGPVCGDETGVEFDRCIGVENL